MKPFRFLAGLLMLLPAVAQPQPTMVKKDSSGDLRVFEGQPFILNELGAPVVFSDGTLKVLNVMPPDRRPGPYKEIDLQQNDVIVMANAKHLRTVKDLESIYNNLNVGEVLKLGVRRNSDLHLVSFAKGDPKDLPHLQMRISRGGPGDEPGMFPLVGAVMKMKGKEIVVDELVPGENPLKHANVKAGDVLVSMNNKSFTSLREYDRAFDKIPAGETVQWTLRRGDKEHTVTFTKPEAKVIIRHGSANQ